MTQDNMRRKRETDEWLASLRCKLSLFLFAVIVIPHLVMWIIIAVEQFFPK